MVRGLKSRQNDSSTACHAARPPDTSSSSSSRSAVKSYATYFSKKRSRNAVSSRPDSSAKKRRSEEHTSELQSLMRISYAVFCLKKKKEHKAEIHTVDKQASEAYINKQTTQTYVIPR